MGELCPHDKEMYHSGMISISQALYNHVYSGDLDIAITQFSLPIVFCEPYDISHKATCSSLEIYGLMNVCVIVI